MACSSVISECTDVLRLEDNIVVVFRDVTFSGIAENPVSFMVDGVLYDGSSAQLYDGVLGTYHSS